MSSQELNKKLTKPQLTELAAYLYMRYETSKSLQDDEATAIMKFNKGEGNS